MFCPKCGTQLNDDALFCSKCGSPVPNSGATVKRSSHKTTAVIIIAVAITAILAVTCIFLLSSSNKLSGRYGYHLFNNGSYAYSIEFKSNGSCLWSQDGSTFSGTYEYSDNEYIIKITGNGYYLSTTFRAQKSGDSLYITGGVFHDAEFVKF